MSNENENKVPKEKQVSVDDLRRELGMKRVNESPAKKKPIKKNDPVVKKAMEGNTAPPEPKLEQEENGELNTPKQNNRKGFNLVLTIIAGLFLVVIGTILLTRDNSSEVSFNTGISNPTEVKEKEINTYHFEEISLGEVDETVYAGKHELFDVFFNNDDKVQEYGFYQDNQQSELLIIPTSTKYEVEVTNIKEQGKTITVEYKTGGAKIGRMVGHIAKFEAKAYVIDFRNIESAKFTVKFVNEDGNETQENFLDFTKPFYRSTWETTNLAWGDKDQLMFSANIEGDWQIWSYDMNKDNEPIQFTTRHKDAPLNILATMGIENINIPILNKNNKTGKLLYHASYDIFSINPDGTGNHPLTTSTNQPTVDGMTYFDYMPKSTTEGSWIYYLRVFDPQTNELWKMYYDGSQKERVFLPQDGYVEDFLISPKDDNLVVAISNRQSELMNGGTSVWAVPIDHSKKSLKSKKKQPSYMEEDTLEKESKKVEARKLTTVGYKVRDLHMSPSDDKTLLFSMKEHATSSDLLTDIWSVNINNTNLTRLTPKDSYMDTNPTFSNDGSKIAFLSGNGSYNNLWVMDKNGDNRRALDMKIQAVGTPLWSEDDKKVYISDIKGNIFEFNLNEEKIYRVVQGH